MGVPVRHVRCMPPGLLFVEWLPAKWLKSAGFFANHTTLSSVLVLARTSRVQISLQGS